MSLIPNSEAFFNLNYRLIKIQLESLFFRKKTLLLKVYNKGLQT